MNYAYLSPGSDPTWIDIAVRCAEVDIVMMGKRIKANLGGVAVAGFPDVEDVSVEDLRPGESFRVDWHDAFFFGEHSLLGPMHVRLRPIAQTPQTGTSGMVRSLAEQSSSGGPTEGAFLPAINRNEFHWRIRLPRFDLVLNNPTALVNEAVINALPPVEEEYNLVDPVTFKADIARSGPLARMTPEFEIETCRVKLQELKDLNTTVMVVSQTEDFVEFELLFKNESSEDNVEVSWMLWPRPEEGENGQGTLKLGRDPVSKRVKLPRDLFFRERFLATSISKPFETKGANVSVFPSLN